MIFCSFYFLGHNDQFSFIEFLCNVVVETVLIYYNGLLRKRKQRPFGTPSHSLSLVLRDEFYHKPFSIS